MILNELKVNICGLITLRVYFIHNLRAINYFINQFENKKNVH